MDVERTDFQPIEITHRVTGEKVTGYERIRSIVLLKDLDARTEIFSMDECRTSIFLVTDALAERILLAGCTACEFRDRGYYDFSNGTTRYGAAKGVVERPN